MKNYIYIGDNEKVLKLKKSKLRNSVDIIYIDPPYNTALKKSYKDSEYSNGSWREMMFPRLKLSLDILSDSGVIFISIDDNQLASLKIICDEIFGEDNFLGIFITKQAQRSNSKHINITHEYIVGYSKNKKKVPRFERLRIDDLVEGPMIKDIVSKVKREFDSKGLESADKVLKTLIKNYCERFNITWLKNYNRISDDGRVFFGKDLSTPGSPRSVDIPEINLHLEPLPTRGWSSDEKFIQLHKDDRLYFRGERPYEITYLIESKDHVPSILDFYSRQGTNDLNNLGLRDLFDTPKPVELIKYLIKIYPGDSLVVCDFFAGSGTTAQAVLELNEEYNQNHSFILVQSKEELDESTKPYKTAISFNIEPYVSEIMLYRINTFLEKNNLKDIEIIIEEVA